MKFVAWPLVGALFLLSGCAPLPEQRFRDKDRLGSVQIGMTKAEFLRVMGTELMMVYRPDGHIRQIIQNPYSTEVIEKGSATYEIITYFANPRAKEGTVTPDELFDYVFLDGKLIGSGPEFVEQLCRVE